MSSTTIDRVCAGCEREFRGKQRMCPKCQVRDRECTGCGKPFRAARSKCSACTRTRKECSQCGAEFTSVRGNKRCMYCSTGKVRGFLGSQKARCGCGRGLVMGDKPACWRCIREKGRACPGCGKVHRNSYAFCHLCRTQDRVCGCGRPYRGAMFECRQCMWDKLPLGEKEARKRQYDNRRRALKLRASVDGPVSAATYRSVVESGPCVYCGGHASTVDHVVPLARGGWEHESNLVPCCTSCNSSKCDRLLIEWDRNRVEHAARISVIVAVAWCAARAPIGLNRGGNPTRGNRYLHETRTRHGNP
jgi:hypothetical protein